MSLNTVDKLLNHTKSSNIHEASMSENDQMKEVKHCITADERQS